jgi:integrase
LYFYGGFRPIEVCQLKWKDITFDKEGCYVKTISNKNHREFQKYLPEDVCFYIRKLKERSFNSEYLFPTKRTNKHGISVGDMPMTRSGVYQHLIPLAKRVLNKHVNPYILRHSIATILYNRDDLKDDDVAQQMGHSKAMKMTYNNLSIEKIRARMKKIWIKPEDLPEAKKHELELKLAQVTEWVKILQKTESIREETFKSVIESFEREIKSLKR